MQRVLVGMHLRRQRVVEGRNSLRQIHARPGRTGAAYKDAHLACGREDTVLGNPGSYGKHLKRYLEPELWTLLEKTYSDAGYESTWEALDATCGLFRLAANRVAEHFGFDYPRGDDERVIAHLHRMRSLPKDAKELY